MSELLVGMLSYSYIQDVRSDLAQSLADSFQAFYHMDSEFTQSVDLIQSKVSYYIRWRVKISSSKNSPIIPYLQKIFHCYACGIHKSNFNFGTVLNLPIGFNNWIFGFHR